MLERIVVNLKSAFTAIVFYGIINLEHEHILSKIRQFLVRFIYIEQKTAMHFMYNYWLENTCIIVICEKKK